MMAPPSNPASHGKAEVLLSVRNAARVYDMGEVKVTALRGVTLDLYKGEFLVIVGPSGSGKSTLLNLLGGMDRPSSGAISVGSLDLTHATEKQLTQYRRHAVGFIFQLYNLVPTLTALENIQVATEMVSDAMDPLEALDQVGLKQRADHFPSQLSGGEQQRVSIARAIAKKPMLLLCDEPTGALDIETGKHILEILLRFKAELGQTVAFITHNADIAKIGDRVALIKDGVIESIAVNEHPLTPGEVQW